MFYASGTLRVAAYVSMLEGKPGQAERDLREGVEIARRIGDLGHLSSTAPLLADSLYALGRDDEALALTEEGEQATIEGDVDAQMHWQRVRGKILARRGQHEDAVLLATKAVEVARSTDYLDLQGWALLDLAEVLQLTGRPEEAIPVLREALDAFERKGNVVMAKRARALLEELSSA
jgi:tetratricopeptide (TPR) repeat protein